MGEGWGAYREGRDGGGEVLGDREVGAVRVGLRSGGDGGVGGGGGDGEVESGGEVESRGGGGGGGEGEVESDGGEVDGGLGRRR